MILPLLSLSLSLVHAAPSPIASLTLEECTATVDTKVETVLRSQLGSETDISAFLQIAHDQGSRPFCQDMLLYEQDHPSTVEMCQLSLGNQVIKVIDLIPNVPQDLKDLVVQIAVVELGGVCTEIFGGQLAWKKLVEAPASPEASMCASALTAQFGAALDQKVVMPRWLKLIEPLLLSIAQRTISVPFCNKLLLAYPKQDPTHPLDRVGLCRSMLITQAEKGFKEWKRIPEWLKAELSKLIEGEMGNAFCRKITLPQAQKQ